MITDKTTLDLRFLSHYPSMLYKQYKLVMFHLLMSMVVCLSEHQDSKILYNSAEIN